MSRLEALFDPQRPQKPAFIVSPKLQLNALHFAVAELYESFNEYRSRISSATPTLLYDAPLALVLEKFPAKDEINHADRNGWTAMHIAALNSNVQAVTQILDAGGDPNLQTKRGWTVLDCAQFAKSKWSQSHAISDVIDIQRAHVANLGALRARSNAVVEVLEGRGAVREQRNRFLTVVKVNLPSKEWDLYKYLDATKT
jgi:Ankyrin repeats (many copies)